MGKTVYTDERRSRFAEPNRQQSHDIMFHLSLAMGEIVDLMGGSGALLTLHASSAAEPAIVYADGRLPQRSREAMLDHLTRGVRLDFNDDQCFWREAVDGDHPMLLMPVTQRAGHSRLVISLLFDKADAAVRARAEQLFRERKPFAVGFFQLWQQNRMLQQRIQSFESVVDQIAIGLVVIDRTSQIIFANGAAAEILAAGDGIGRTNGALRATSFADGVNLQAAISHAMAWDEGWSAPPMTRAPLVSFKRRKGPPLVAAFLPAMWAPVEQGDVAVIMYLVDPQIDAGRMLAPLCRLYGLSPVETALVCHLTAGETIASAAQHMHVKEQTARGYLKTVFIKTRTKRQTELVVLMLSSLIRMKRSVMQEALTTSDSARRLDCAPDIQS